MSRYFSGTEDISSLMLIFSSFNLHRNDGTIKLRADAARSDNTEEAGGNKYLAEINFNPSYLESLRLLKGSVNLPDNGSLRKFLIIPSAVGSIAPEVGTMASCESHNEASFITTTPFCPLAESSTTISAISCSMYSSLRILDLKYLPRNLGSTRLAFPRKSISSRGRIEIPWPPTTSSSVLFQPSLSVRIVQWLEPTGTPVATPCQSSNMSPRICS